MKNKTSKIFSAAYFACIISCILLSVYLVSDVWARYFSEAAGSDGARVTKWDVTAEFTGESRTFSLSQGKSTVSFPYSIINNSEVAITYHILLTIPDTVSLPDDVTFAVGNVTANKIDANVYCIQNIETLSPLCGEQRREMKITAKDFSSNMDLNAIQVKVIISQAD